MADFIAPAVTQRIITATEKLETQANRAESLIDNLENVAPSAVASVNGQTGVVVLDADDIASGATNQYMTSAEKSKLNSIEEGAEVNDVTSVNGATGAVVLDTDDVAEGDTNKYFPEAPLDGQQYARKSGAWAVVVGGGGGGSSYWGGITGTLSDQTDLQSALDGKADDSEVTASAIKTKYESNADTNAYTDAEKSKLAGIEAGAEVNTVASVNGATGVVVLDTDDIAEGTNKYISAADKIKLAGIEAGAEVNTVDSVFGRTGAVVATAGDYTSAQVSAGASATNYTPSSATVAGHLAGIDTALAAGGGNPYEVTDTASYTDFQNFTTVDALGSGVYKVLTALADTSGYLPSKVSANDPYLIKVYKVDSTTYSLEATLCANAALRPAGNTMKRTLTSAGKDSGWYDPSYVATRFGSNFTKRWDTYTNLETGLLQGYVSLGKNHVKGGANVGMPSDAREYLVELTRVVNGSGNTYGYHMVAWVMPSAAPSTALTADQWVRSLNSAGDSGWIQITGL